jgi:hypothetical protein
MAMNTEFDDRSDEFSLKPFLQTLYSHRHKIVALVAASMLLFGVVALARFLRAPVESTATLHFRPLFRDSPWRGLKPQAGRHQGAVEAETRYPNGTPFSSADILATPVLTQVFEANQLERFGTFRDFRSALFVVQSNPEIDLLSYEYQSKLSDAKLTPVDRARIEEEFRQKRDSLPVGYALSFRRSEGATRMPQELLSKVLDDILSVWAAQAAERRGVLKYDVSVLSKNILTQGSLETEDYVVVVDILRSKIRRTLANIDEIAALPGAALMRTGQEQVSLAEVRANLEDVLRFKVQPLIGLIRSTGLSKDPELSILYLEHQLSQSRLEANQAAGQVRTLQDSLRQYMQQGQTVAGEQSPGGPRAGSGQGSLNVPAMIPQFSESFLDRLIQMTAENNDVEFRQEFIERVTKEGLKAVALEKDAAYYDDLIGALRGALREEGRTVRSEVRQRAAEVVKAKAAETVTDLTRALDQVNAIYTDLSAHNLNPGTLLYAVTQPFRVSTTRTLGLRALAIAGLLVFILATILSAAVVLAYGYIRREIIAAPAVGPETIGRPADQQTKAESHGPAVVG